ncbi:MAG: class I SAM-dependent methyltransferase [Ignavibacteria bacterium]|nr:class I SAM-dependent methyltransferase [Ignavibacteria bacterium]
MESKENKNYWEENAEAWTVLSREGYDLYRNHLNTPAFFEILPDVKGLKGIDIGCGEGYNTRLLAEKGADMTAIDISELFIKYAQMEEEKKNFGIKYSVADGEELPFKNESFDFAAAFMSLMDIPDSEKAVKEIYRILKPGGFFQFSISHPCFATPYRKNLRNTEGTTYALEVGKYFDKEEFIEEWIFNAAPAELRNSFPKFRIPRFPKTISEWFNMLIKNGFSIEHVNEPRPDEDTVKKIPHLQDAQVISYFLQIRCRK